MPAKPSVAYWLAGVIWPFKYLCLSHDNAQIKHKEKDMQIYPRMKRSLSFKDNVRLFFSAFSDQIKKQIPKWNFF